MTLDGLDLVEFISSTRSSISLTDTAAHPSSGTYECVWTSNLRFTVAGPANRSFNGSEGSTGETPESDEVDDESEVDDVAGESVVRDEYRRGGSGKTLLMSIGLSCEPDPVDEIEVPRERGVDGKMDERNDGLRL